MIFTKDQTALILAGKQSATLQPAERAIHPDTVRNLRRRVMRHDADGHELGWETTTVEQGDGEDRQPVRITILTADVIQLEQLTLQQAQWCGHKTIVGCQTAWDANYPAVLVALLVRFALGDLRDRDRYLSRGIGYTSSPQMALAPDAPAVPPDELRRQVVDAREADEQRLSDPDIRLRLTLARALEEWELETGGRASNRQAFQSICAIRDQVRALDRRIKAA